MDADLAADFAADLAADCDRCAALCCVAFAFDASAAFAGAKPAGARCRHLKDDDRCGIHNQLRTRGYGGCAAFSCHGAGPRATRLQGVDDVTRQRIFRALCVLHELRALVDAARGLVDDDGLDERARALAAVDDVLAVDVYALRKSVLAELRALAPRFVHLRVI